MHTTRLKRVGGSVMLTVPPALLNALSLGTDNEVGMVIDNGRLIVEPYRRPQYSLAELLETQRSCKMTGVPRNAFSRQFSLLSQPSQRGSKRDCVTTFSVFVSRTWRSRRELPLNWRPRNFPYAPVPATRHKFSSTISTSSCKTLASILAKR